ncbi:fumarylacetoacetate hydrolase [Paraburkholderia sp. BL27I4N3]|uniref:fumarylacetoacetase n=1 Tax=Paraburkholderia sp. BL27I4N3 TaxID=1938805 RepID=UPI000E22ECFD|nr:fumarylacetoacetase [Paraburkholderia sp. BL27I4N3]REE07287.1 fumarylacetoacetate hydrolase [Paraburkholderia sp. BL27I4N3]
MTRSNHTHDVSRKSWVRSANDGATDFPVQNLPHGVFRRASRGEDFRGGIAIGDQILDVGAALASNLFPAEAREAAQAAARAPLNDYMALSPDKRSAVRSAVSFLLSEDCPQQKEVSECLVPQADAEYALPARIENFSDFYSSLSHATNVGRLFRPDNPILPNYRWLPVGYHGRTSSIRVSGQDFRRPTGQLKDPNSAEPEFAPSRRLDYEAELGVLIGQGNELGTAIDIQNADAHVFGVCLLNDWSARDIQSWEYQPLGPFLAKSFFTSLSPWIVTLEALEPYRVGFSRPEGDPAPMPHLSSPELATRGSIDIRVETLLQSAQMRTSGAPPASLSISRYPDAYWAMSQLVAHQTSNGTNLCPGDLLGSGTLSGPDPASRACLLELTEGGKHPFTLPGGEIRTFLEDGDTVIMRAWCERDGYRRIGFGECRATVLPARRP